MVESARAKNTPRNTPRKGASKANAVPLKHAAVPLLKLPPRLADCDPTPTPSDASNHQQISQLEAELQKLKLQNLQLSQNVESAKAAEEAALKRCAELEQQIDETKASNDLVAAMYKDLAFTRMAKVQAEDAFQSLLKQLFEMRSAKVKAEHAHQKLARQVKELKQQLQQQQQHQQQQRVAEEPASHMPLSARGKGKREPSVLKLVSELKRYRATAEKAEGELQKLREEKERVEESQDMIAMQTAALLKERQWLMSKVEQKELDARSLQQEMDKVVHELSLVAGDRELLLSRVQQLMGLENLSPEMLLDSGDASLDSGDLQLLPPDDEEGDSECSAYTPDLMSPDSTTPNAAHELEAMGDGAMVPAC